MIEEMAQIINGSTELDTVAYYRCMNIAKTIYNAGYRKIPEDSVVLSREEYKRLLDNAIRVDMEYLDHELAKTRKKTAKEILQRLYDKCYEVQGLREGYAHIIPLDILILAKEYSVEVKE